MELGLDPPRASSPRTPMPDWKDEDLVAECLTGNEHAWAAVVDKYKGLVYSAPMKYRMTPQDAADIFQEVWLDLYNELGNLRKPGALGGWLASVASHKCFHWKRAHMQLAEKQAAEFDREPVAREMSFPVWKEQQEKQQMLREVVGQLPDRCRDMVTMLFYREPPTPYAEVARELGLAEGSIGFMRGRCLDKLRVILQEKGF